MDNYRNNRSERITESRNLSYFAAVALTIVLLFFVGEFWQSVKSKKPDFAALYATGKLVRNGGHLIRSAPPWVTLDADPNYPQAKADTLHPPIELLIFVPLSCVPYSAAYLLWLVLNLSMLWILAHILWKYLDELQLYFYFAVIIIGSALPTILSLIFGQDSILLLLLLTLALVQFEKGRFFVAGVILGGAIFKFQCILPVLLLYLLRRSWRLCLGFLISSVSLFVAAVSLFGSQMVVSYFPYVFQVGKNLSGFGIERSNLMPNIRGLIAVITSYLGIPGFQRFFTILFSVIIIGIAWAAASKFAPSVRIEFAIFLTAASLVSYHWYAYNSVVLLLPVLILASAADSTPISLSALGVSFGSVYALPLLLPLHVGMPVMAVGSLCLFGVLVESSHSERSLTKGQI